MGELTTLIQLLVSALEQGFANAEDASIRNDYAELLAAAGDAASAIAAGDLGRAASILHPYERAFGWSSIHLPGPFGERATRAFDDLREALRSARLHDAPDAGFGH
jgi:hypothetical protein